MFMFTASCKTSAVIPRAFKTFSWSSMMEFKGHTTITIFLVFFTGMKWGRRWNSIDLPNPVGKTPMTSWPCSIDSKHLTCRGLKLSDGKLPLLREKPTRRSTDKNFGLPAMFIVCDRMLISMLIYYTHKCWVFGGHVTGRYQGLFPPRPQSQGKAPWGRGCFVLWKINEES